MEPTETLESARRRIETADFVGAYADLHASLEALGAAGMHEALAHHLVLMADTALSMTRPDLALLNLETAARVFAELGDEEVGPTLARRIAELDEALRQPFESLAEEIDWYVELIRHFVRATARAAVLHKRLRPDQHFEFEVSDEEFELFCEAHYPADAELSRLQREVVAFRAWTARRQVATEDDGALVLGVMRRFGLDGLERHLLVAALLPALYPDVQRAYIRLWGDYLKREPDVAFLARLVAVGHDEERAALRALGPTETLCRTGLARVYPGDLPPSAPRLNHSVAAADAVVQFALGQRRLSPLQAAADGPGPGAPALHESVTAALAELLVPPDAFACVTGPEGAGKRTMVAAAARALGLPLLQLRVGPASVAGGAALEALRDGLRDARVLDGVLLLDATRLGEAAKKVTETLRAVFARHAEDPCRVVLVTDTTLDVVWEYVDRRHLLRVSLPTTEEQRQVWTWRLGALIEEHAAHARLVEEVVERYPLTPDSIRRAAADAVARGRQRGHAEGVTLDDLLWAAQAQTNARLQTVAERVDTSLKWEDLVLPQDVFVALNELITYYRYRETVFDEWGFKRKLPYGRALSALFHGPPGTGKTMTAAVLAREFGQALYRVDLSSVVSKYIGETEKNLDRVFEEASFARAIILFDEADSLFGRRTDVQTSVDRYSNLEVNFLLQKMEAFEGIVILTTNLERGIDEAFKRRIRFKIHFPFPDVELREMLWGSMLPHEAKREGDLEFDLLAHDFEMAGANIKNAVVRAAFRAAEVGGTITADGLRDSAMQEYKEMGKLVREYRDDYDLS